MTRYIIIGGSAAGISCCEAIRKIDQEGQIILISEEKLPLYSRCLLTYFISGRITKEKLYFKESDFYSRHRVDALHGIKAVDLDVKRKKVTLEDGKELEFDKLLIATGGVPKKINIDGEDKEGVFSLRNIRDAEEIVSFLPKTRQVVILGGGLIGLRDAYALKLNNKDIKVVVKSPQILSQMVDKDAADIIEDRLKEEGIEVIKGFNAKKIIGAKSVEGVVLENNETLPCQMVIVAKGILPQVDIIKNTNILYNKGILVDAYLQTSQKDIYAAGDVAESLDIPTQKNRVNAVWPVAVEQGRIAGLNMAGKKMLYEGSNMMNSTDLFGLAVISMGVTKPPDESYESLIFKEIEEKTYKKIVLKNNIICGAIFINRIDNAGVINLLMRKRLDISYIKDKLISIRFDYAKILSLIKEHPDIFDDIEFKETVKSL